MKTKLISFILILMLSAPLAIAQSTDKGKTSFGILGGVNMQNLNGKDINGNKLTNDLTHWLSRRNQYSDTCCSGILFSTRIAIFH